MSNTTNNSDIANEIIKLLNKKPDGAERFDLNGDGTKIVDFILFTDRPYIGASCIITNGVSSFVDGYENELVLIFETQSINENDDLNALLATYLQLYYLNNYTKVSVGDTLHSNGKLMRGYKYEGFYTTLPLYFHEDMLNKISDTNFYWLMPIFPNEYDYIMAEGSLAFESFLEKNDPNMAIFDRNPLPLTRKVEP